MQIDVCCFDKTGTLTSDEMVLQGILPPSGGSLQPRGDHAAQRILAACQALILVEGKYVGDPLETTVFQASGVALRQLQGLTSHGNGVEDVWSKRLQGVVWLEEGAPSNAVVMHMLGSK